MPSESGMDTDPVATAAKAVVGRASKGIEPSMSVGVGFGGALRTLREARGLSLEDVAQTTRVRRAYLAAIEEMRLDQLPSRPFAIGYVRAYAQVLGIDADAAVARFKQSAPFEENEPLRAPVGVRRQRDPRVSVAAAAAGVVLTAVLIWNLAQHAVAGDGPPTPPAPVLRVAPSAALRGAVHVASAQPAPPESDVPKPYITPGLAPATAVDAQQVQAAAIIQPPTFVAKGEVFGAPANQSPVTLQASKPASLVVRGADGTVYFARQLAAGEAYRAPVAVKGLVVDVSEPQAFNVYLNGAAHGQLAASQTPIAKIAG